MNAIRIRKHLNSDTLHLPELRGMIGHDVEITVVEQPELTREAGRKFWQTRSLEELAAEQGYVSRNRLRFIVSSLSSLLVENFASIGYLV